MIRNPAVLCLVSISLLACGGAKPPDATSAAAAPASEGAAPIAKETPAQAAGSGSVQLAPEILKACGISQADAFFPFDSSLLEKKDIKPLNDVATCFSTGPMKGRSMKLVGHADPRGESGYNMTLGQSRADSVQTYLVDKKVDRSHAQSTSRGAMDATGTDDAGWALDRRVDVMLGS